MKIYYALLLFLLASACRNDSSPPWNSDPSYEETKLTLEEQEQANPLSFLQVTGSYRKNIWGNFIVEGSIQNKASIATFKDPVIKFSFYSKTGTHLGDENLVWYEFIGPGKSFDFSEKFTGYNAANEVKIELTGAKANT